MEAAELRVRIRLDKWLWAARFFKTRALATEAVSGGRVHLNGARAKPGKVISIGDEVRVKRGPYKWVLIVRGFGSRRGSASQARLLYEESEQSKRDRETLTQQMRALGPRQPDLKGRPSKKARREIVRFTQGEWS
ncbi:MAG: RNA-binding S4 domain-containing protein [Candidatus Binatia bacterium]